MSSSKQLCTNSMDSISELSDSVLIHILSLMPTLYAVRTSKLARRWRYLWKSVHRLNFDMDQIKDDFFPLQDAIEYCTQFNKRGKFKICETEKLMHDKVIKFVDGVLLSHARSNIETFDLTCVQDFIVDAYLSAINTWVPAVVSHNIQEISLSLSLTRVVRLPPCMFTCDTLSTLNLTMFDQTCFELPFTIRFANLKTMRLSYVAFFDENLTRRLFSCCPVFENLYILYCRLSDTFSTLDISVPSLKKLVLKCSSRTSVLVLCAPKLDCFIFEGFMLGLPRTSLPSLTKSNIAFDQDFELDVTAMKPVIEILNFVHMSRYMTICAVCVKVLGKFFEMNVSSRFCHLKQLEITMMRLNPNWEPVIHLIETNLELDNLIVNLTVPPKYGYYLQKLGNLTNDKQMDPVKYECLSSSEHKNLTSIKMMNAVGGSEVSFLKYLLRTQSRLKEMSVKFHCDGWESRERVSMELFHSPRLATGLSLLVF